jgi:DNA-directed RNA polymerase specialized sigma24 family protein
MMSRPDLPDWFHSGYLSLPEMPRAVYTLSARHGLTHGQICICLGIPLEEVERHLADALIHFDRVARSHGQ